MFYTVCTHIYVCICVCICIYWKFLQSWTRQTPRSSLCHPSRWKSTGPGTRDWDQYPLGLRKGVHVRFRSRTPGQTSNLVTWSPPRYSSLGGQRPPGRRDLGCICLLVVGVGGWEGRGKSKNGKKPLQVLGFLGPRVSRGFFWNRDPVAKGITGSGWTPLMVFMFLMGWSLTQLAQEGPLILWGAARSLHVSEGSCRGVCVWLRIPPSHVRSFSFTHSCKWYVIEWWLGSTWKSKLKLYFTSPTITVPVKCLLLGLRPRLRRLHFDTLEPTEVDHSTYGCDDKWSTLGADGGGAVTTGNQTFSPEGRESLVGTEKGSRGVA